jgi:hypothetical protein
MAAPGIATALTQARLRWVCARTDEAFYVPTWLTIMDSRLARRFDLWIRGLW